MWLWGSAMQSEGDEDDSDDEPVELGTEMLLQAPTAEESDDGSFDEDGVRSPSFRLNPNPSAMNAGQPGNDGCVCAANSPWCAASADVEVGVAC